MSKFVSILSDEDLTDETVHTKILSTLSLIFQIQRYLNWFNYDRGILSGFSPIYEYEVLAKQFVFRSDNGSNDDICNQTHPRTLFASPL